MTTAVPVSQESPDRTAPARAGSPDDPTRPKAREAYIDCCRGLLVLLMASSHCTTLVGLSHDHWLVSHGLPRGWATVGFVSLSGFLIGALFSSRAEDPRTTRRLVRRSGELLVVMFLSNVILLVAKHLAQGSIQVIQHPAWWCGLVTLRTTYSISSVLIPTASLVFVSPLLLKAATRTSPYCVFWFALAATLGLNLAKTTMNSHQEPSYMLRLLVFGGNGFFPLLPFVLYGSICIPLGILWKRGAFWLSIALALAFVVTAGTTHGSLVSTSISGPAKMLIVLAIAVTMQRVSVLDRITSFFARIGEFGLFAFVLHRIALQATKAVLDISVPNVSPELEYAALLLVCMPGLWVACRSRLSHPEWNAFLKRLYL